MTDLVVRRLLVDLETPFPARWNGGDAFRSALFNALSMSFPVGEQYFMDSVRAGVKVLPEAEQLRLSREVDGFVGQEATHRRLHGLFNTQLDKLGYKNVVAQRAAARMKANAHRPLHLHVASTAAVEHFTAIFANWVFRHPEIFAGAEPRLQTFWFWHAAEESEHRSTAFDIYTALGGNHEARVAIFRYVTFTFLTDIFRQTVRNLWHDGSLFQWSTWRSAAHTLFAPDGLIRSNRQAWRDYMAVDFHPSRQSAPLATQWLQTNTAKFAVVGA